MKIEKYKCEVCGMEHDTEEECQVCKHLCNSPYMYYRLTLDTYEGDFVLIKEGMTMKPNLLDTVCRMEMESEEGCNKIFWDICVVRGMYTENEVRDKLIEAARLWLTGLIKELDKLTYFQP